MSVILFCHVPKYAVFSTAADYQSEVKIEILQGEEPYAEDNVQLGVVTVAVPKKKKGMESVDVRFTYDINGILEVEVTVVSTGKSCEKSAVSEHG